MEAVWGNEQIGLLIDLYKERRFLWDASHIDYKNKTKKNDAWVEISTLTNMPQKEVETKMHTLRSQFAREKKKFYNSKKTGSGTDQILKSKWIWYDSFEFLLCGATNSGLSDTYTTDEITSNASTTESLLTSPSPPPPPPPPESYNSMKRKNEDNLKEAFQIMNSAKKRMDDEGKKDELEIYGQYVASELRQMQDQQAVVQAKYYINNILVQTRMGYLSGYGDGGYGHGHRSTSATSTCPSNTSTPAENPEPPNEMPPPSTVDAVKTKWKHVRDYYVRHKRNLSLKGETKNDKWPYTAQCEFLDNFSMMKNNPKWQENVFEEQDTSSSDANLQPYFETLLVQPGNPEGHLKRELEDAELEIESVEPARKIIKNDNDSVDHLFMSYAGTFKQFSPKNQIKLKLKLAQIFADTEMLELNERSDT